MASSTKDPSKPADSTATARSYYNSSSADTFYHTLWGGEDIHIGIYTSSDNTIALASQRTVERLAAVASSITASTRILDLGAGYGGAARYLARKYGCKVTCLNLSEIQNERNRQKNREQGLAELIEVVDGAFEKLPFEDGSFELVWSQDAFLHSNERGVVVGEIARVLVREGGSVVFTDPMAKEDAELEKLVPIRKRLSLESEMATRGFYRDEFLKRGFEDAGFEDCTEQLVTHYSRVLAALKEVQSSSSGISEEFVKNAETGMVLWIEGGKQGQLDWGIFHFRR